MVSPSVKAKLAAKLDGHIENIATNLHGEPTTVRGTELRFRNKGALSVDTEKQCYYDFEANPLGFRPCPRRAEKH